MSSKLSLILDTVSALPTKAHIEAERALIDVRNRHVAPLTLTVHQQAFVKEGLDASARGNMVPHDTLVRSIAQHLGHDQH